MSKIEAVFTPTSKITRYFDTSFKFPKPTLISYQYGKLNGKSAIRFFFKGRETATRYVDPKKKSAEFSMSDYGGQPLGTVNRQREQCLETIVKRLFEKLRCNVENQPVLDGFTPDLLITKKFVASYVELKAYHASYICGDPEIAQAMKYFKKVLKLTQSNGNCLNLPLMPKVLLITSGTLINRQESFLENLDTDPLEHVTKFYNALKIPWKSAKTLDQQSARDIYRHSVKKFTKNIAIGFAPMKVFFFQESDVPNFRSYLFFRDDFDVLLLTADAFYQILRQENLYLEAHKFDLLRITSMEKLILNRNTIEI